MRSRHRCRGAILLLCGVLLAAGPAPPPARPDVSGDRSHPGSEATAVEARMLLDLELLQDLDLLRELEALRELAAPERPTRSPEEPERRAP